MRYVWVDWMKSILIILMVLGHSGSLFTPYIYLFHIPAFFFVSGYLSNYSKPNQGSFSSSKYLIYAVMIYNLFFMVLNCIKAHIEGVGLMHAGGGTDFYELVIRPILGITWCYYKGSPIPNPLCGQFWFVWVLLIIRYLYRIIAGQSLSFKLIICFLCIIYSSIIYHFEIFTFFYIDRFVMALPFFIVGNLLKNIKIVSCDWGGGKIRKKYKNVLLSMLLMLLCIFVYYIFNNEMPDMFHFRLGNSVILFYIVAFVGTYSLMLFCKVLPEYNIVKTISIGTFLILALHLIILSYLNLSIIEIDKTRILALMIVLLICVPCISVANRRWPILLGKKMKNK